MIRIATMLSVILLLATVKLACADSFDDCVQDCSRAQTQCIEAITLYDETGVKELKDACAKQMKACQGEKCHSEDAAASGGAEQMKAEAEEAEKKRQEQQQETVNGEIKVYKFD